MSVDVQGRLAVRPVVATSRFVFDLLGYGAVSAIALVCDYGLLLSLAGLGLTYPLAATLSFSAGMVVAYVLSARFVFVGRRRSSRRTEALGFFAIGIAGLLLTQALLYLFISKCGLPLAVAKIPTAGACFLFNFLCRRGLVFAGARAGLEAA